MSAADCCSGPSRNTVLPPSVPSSLHASSSIWIATASRCAMWSGRPTTAASSKAIFLRPSATASTCASRRPRTPTRAMSKPCIASKKTSSSTSKISEAAAISLPRSTPISFTSTWCDPTPTRKIKVPGKSSSGLLLAHPSNSACFHPSSWITTSTTQGDTMSLGFPSHQSQNLQQLAGGDGDLHYVGGHAGGIGAGGDFRAAAVEGFKLPVVQRGAGDGHVVAGVAVLAVGEDLDELRAGQLVDDLREIQRVAASGVIPRKGERADGVEQIAAGAVDVAGQKRDGDGHFSLLFRFGVRRTCRR